MVRRATARISLVEKTSLRQCIRPLMEPRAPGQDEFRCVSVLTSRSVVYDHYRYQVSDTPFDCSFVLAVPVQTSWKIDCSEGVVCARPLLADGAQAPGRGQHYPLASLRMRSFPFAVLQD